MAQRRMFSKKITDTDLFLEMPLSSQALYFHLNMHADDDGFVANAKTIKRMTGASEDDLKILLAKQFIFSFESGVVVIKDWKIHNYIRKDTYNSTIYGDEKRELVEDGNGAYTRRGRAVDDPSPQVRLGKDRLGKVSKDIDIASATSTPKFSKKDKPGKHKYGEYKNVLLTDEQLAKLKSEFPKDWQDRIERVSGYVQSSGKHYKDYLATIRNWAKRDQQSNQSNKVAPQTRKDWFG
ncbi:replisome organizer [Lactiplantibacillus plantarum]|uniref:replisome organizer n=1 Tax=Lactiplantibacillus plantarum TaxID=1590 RepID=UPI003F6574A0